MKIRSEALGTAGFLIAVVALLVALTSGTAYAAVTITTKNIKKNAVTSAKIAPKAVTGAKIAPNAVTGATVKNGTLTLSDFTRADQKRLLGPRPADAVRVEMNSIYVGAYDFSTVTVWCPGARKVTGGGFISSIAIPSASAPNSDRSGWVIQINNMDNSISVEASAYAVCS
ncbi:hypothetical protein [Aeromicrobium sp. 179-A 4D2 NHS]|uniref:hypothetical protein n=1 Tax=Aeromicrobium sp. 179-A 4D2 NHS TaxID=3142375 RepID=UPI0039A39326